MIQNTRSGITSHAQPQRHTLTYVSTEGGITTMLLIIHLSHTLISAQISKQRYHPSLLIFQMYGCLIIISCFQNVSGAPDFYLLHSFLPLTLASMRREVRNYAMLKYGSRPFPEANLLIYVRAGCFPTPMHPRDILNYCTPRPPPHPHTLNYPFKKDVKQVIYSHQKPQLLYSITAVGNI